MRGSRGGPPPRALLLAASPVPQAASRAGLFQRPSHFRLLARVPLRGRHLGPGRGGGVRGRARDGASRGRPLALGRLERRRPLLRLLARRARPSGTGRRFGSTSCWDTSRRRGVTSTSPRAVGGSTGTRCGRARSRRGSTRARRGSRGSTFSRGGKDLSPLEVTGSVDVIVDAWDLPPLPVPPPWANMPVTPALLRWRVLRDGKVIRPWHAPVDFRRTLLPPSLFAVVFAPGTRQNRPNRPGRYRFYVATARGRRGACETGSTGSRSRPRTCRATAPTPRFRSRSRTAAEDLSLGARPASRACRGRGGRRACTTARNGRPAGAPRARHAARVHEPIRYVRVPPTPRSARSCSSSP